VIAEAADGEEAVRQAESNKPDIAVIDMRIPRLNALDATREILRRLPETRIVVLGMCDDEAYVAQIAKAGGAAYVLKDAADRELATAVSNVAPPAVVTLSPARMALGAPPKEFDPDV
jgi:DNA-binding NarL/FixJ family response regulator